MPVRPLLALALVAASSGTHAFAATRDFAPDARASFAGFQALKTPKADVPVGALWIIGYGPTGGAGAADNLETVRSLSGVTIDKNLQMSLGLGILNLLGIDPKLRDHFTARFSDLSIVRVKDLTKLDGVKGEPRIIEALKAGTISLTSDAGFGLGAQSLTNLWRVTGTSQNDRSRLFSLEGRDMFVAVRVATSEITRGDEEELRFDRGAGSLTINGYLIKFKAGLCAEETTDCPPQVAITKLNTQTEEPKTYAALVEGKVELLLPVPLSDGRGGLYSKLVLRRVPPCEVTKTSGCRREPRFFVQFQGNRLTDVTADVERSW